MYELKWRKKRKIKYKSKFKKGKRWEVKKSKIEIKMNIK